MDVFGPGDGGPVFLSKVQFTGNEAQLMQCRSVGLGEHSCSMENSTGVFCDTRGRSIYLVCTLYTGYKELCDVC